VWRDVPAESCPLPTIWMRYRRYSCDGPWDRILAVLQTVADARREASLAASLKRSKEE